MIFCDDGWYVLCEQSSPRSDYAYKLDWYFNDECGCDSFCAYESGEV